MSPDKTSFCCFDDQLNIDEVTRNDRVYFRDFPIVVGTDCLANLGPSTLYNVVFGTDCAAEL